MLLMAVLKIPATLYIPLKYQRGFMLKENTSEMYQYLQDENIEAFNQARQNGGAVVLKNSIFRGLNLKGANLNGIDLSGCHFKSADLRGIDLRNCNLDGCSLFNAKISGVYFPINLSADEIKLSVVHGTRIRMTV